MSAHVCPICEKDQNEGFCDHFVATLCDDGDGFDVDVPLYFGWNTISPDHDEMVAAMYAYLSQLKGLVKAAHTGSSEKHKAFMEKCSELPSGEKWTLGEALNEVERLVDEADDPGFEIDDAICELQQLFQDAFEEFYEGANWNPELESGSESEEYEISHSPGLTWTGCDYWSSSGGRECARQIAKDAKEAAARIKTLAETVYG